LIFDFPFGTIVQPLWPRRATQAALVLHSLQLITLFSCVYCFFAVSCRQSSSSTGALLFPVAPDPRPPVPRSPPFLRSWTPASWPAVYYAATHPQSGLDRSVGWQTDSAWQWVFSLCSVHFAAYLRSGNVCCHCKFPSLTAYKQPESRAPICPPSRRPWPLFTDRRLNVRRLWALPPDSAALLDAQRLRLSGAMRRTSHRPGALREM